MKKIILSTVFIGILLLNNAFLAQNFLSSDSKDNLTYIEFKGNPKFWFEIRDRSGKSIYGVVKNGKSVKTGMIAKNKNYGFKIYVYKNGKLNRTIPLTVPVFHGPTKVFFSSKTKTTMSYYN